MIIRRFELQDAEQIAQLFHDTIRIVNLGDYTQEQVEAWAPADIHFRNWAEVCSSRCTFVAQKDGLVIGFGELEANGHIDRFYIHHHHQRQSTYCAYQQFLAASVSRLASLNRIKTRAARGCSNLQLLIAHQCSAQRL